MKHSYCGFGGYFFMKKCSNCKEEKPIDLFNNSKNHPSGKNPECKKCVNTRNKKWRNENRERANKRDREYFARTNTDAKKKRNNQLAKERLKIPENAQKNRERWNKYYHENKEKCRETNRKRYNERLQEDPLYKLRCATKSLIQVTLKRKGLVKKSRSKDILGADIEIVKKHLERQFKKGMSWDNYGYKGWHIDHKIPLASAKNEEELLKLFHYTNLQPLWAKDNFDKRDKILPFQTNMGI